MRWLGLSSDPRHQGADDAMTVLLNIDVPDVEAATTFYTAAFGLGDKVRVRGSQSPTSGFRGFTLSLVVPQPSTVDSLISTALAGGVTTLKPAKKH